MIDLNTKGDLIMLSTDPLTAWDYMHRTLEELEAHPDYDPERHLRFTDAYCTAIATIHHALGLD